MAESRSMKVLEVCKVAPANAPANFYLPLTFFDMLWGPFKTASQLFFYRFPEQSIEFVDIILPKLKKSLSLALEYYLPVAGNLTWTKDSDKPVVTYETGDGVSLVVAETLDDFYSFAGDNFHESIHLYDLLPEFLSSEASAPVMTLKITIFPNVGYSIGYVATHAVLDGRSISLFLNSWVYICRKGVGFALPSVLVPFLDRSFVKQQSDLERVYPKSFDINNLVKKTLSKYDDTRPPLDSVLGTFKLTRENINNLRKHVLTYREKKDKLESDGHLSSFTIASAYAMVCLAKAMEIQAEKTFIGINVDARAHLDPPIPSTYFGNCLVSCGGGRSTKDFLSDNGFFVAIEVVKEALASLKDGVVNVAGKMVGLANDIVKDFEGFFIAGSPQMELYKLDFGWGRPIKIEMFHIAATTKAFALLDDRELNGGIEIEISLRKHQAESFSTIFASGLRPGSWVNPRKPKL